MFVFNGFSFGDQIPGQAGNDEGVKAGMTKGKPEKPLSRHLERGFYITKGIAVSSTLTG